MSKHWPNITDQEDYEEYKRRVHNFLDCNQVETVHPSFDDGYPIILEFSNLECECCGRALRGKRYETKGFNKERNEIVGPFWICSDCVHFMVYGQLDDMTMLDIEVNENTNRGQEYKEPYSEEKHADRLLVMLKEYKDNLCDCCPAAIDFSGDSDPDAPWDSDPDAPWENDPDPCHICREFVGLPKGRQSCPCQALYNPVEMTYHALREKGYI